MKNDSSILILGASGLVGSSLVKLLKKERFSNLLTPTRDELDLFQQDQTAQYFLKNRPEFVFMAAAKVGGIRANNQFRADYILENLTIQSNVFNASLKIDIKKFLFVASSCIYPRDSAQPMKESLLLSGYLEKTNEPFAIAKISGVKTAENISKQYGKNYFSVLSCSLYGENDYFNTEKGHVIPGLIARMVEAKKNDEGTFPIWGTGNPRREFLHVDDLAMASIYLMKNDHRIGYYINIGSSQDISIHNLAKKIAQIVGHEGRFVFLTQFPDGAMRKCLDTSKLASTGWTPQINLDEGPKRVIDHYQNNPSPRT